MSTVKINDNIKDKCGSHICECGYLHDYSKINFKELEKETKNSKSYNSVEELMKDL